MILSEDKEQNQNVEKKYLDPEIGIEIELKPEKLYKIRKNTRIVRPTKNTSTASVFNKLDSQKTQAGSIQILEDYEENIFITDDFLEDILNETQADE